MGIHADKFKRMGLPVMQIHGRWYAHAGNIDSLFQELTSTDPGQSV